MLAAGLLLSIVGVVFAQDGEPSEGDRHAFSGTVLGYDETTGILELQIGEGDDAETVSLVVGDATRLLTPGEPVQTDAAGSLIHGANVTFRGQWDGESWQAQFGVVKPNVEQLTHTPQLGTVVDVQESEEGDSRTVTIVDATGNSRSFDVPADQGERLAVGHVLVGFAKRGGEVEGEAQDGATGDGPGPPTGLSGFVTDGELQDRLQKFVEDPSAGRGAATDFAPAPEFEEQSLVDEGLSKEEIDARKAEFEAHRTESEARVEEFRAQHEAKVASHVEEAFERLAQAKQQLLQRVAGDDDLPGVDIPEEARAKIQEAFQRAAVDADHLREIADQAVQKFEQAFQQAQELRGQVQDELHDATEQRRFAEDVGQEFEERRSQGVSEEELRKEFEERLQQHLEQHPPPEGDEPTHEGDEPTREGDEPTHEGDEPTHEGDEPTHEGDEPTREGDEPTHEGDEPTHEGDEPTHEGDEPTHEGDEPTHEGDQPTHEGDEPPPE